jgi:hypothetical protein
MLLYYFLYLDLNYSFFSLTFRMPPTNNKGLARTMILKYLNLLVFIVVSLLVNLILLAKLRFDCARDDIIHDLLLPIRCNIIQILPLAHYLKKKYDSADRNIVVISYHFFTCMVLGVLSKRSFAMINGKIILLFSFLILILYYYLLLSDKKKDLLKLSALCLLLNIVYYIYVSIFCVITSVPYYSLFFTGLYCIFILRLLISIKKRYTNCIASNEIGQIIFKD